EKQLERIRLQPRASARSLGAGERPHRRVEIVVVPLDVSVGLPILRNRETERDQPALRRIDDFLNAKLRPGVWVRGFLRTPAQREKDKHTTRKHTTNSHGILRFFQ